MGIPLIAAVLVGLLHGALRGGHGHYARKRWRALPPQLRPHLISVEIQFGGLEFANKLELPTVRRVHLRVDDSIEVGGDLDLAFAKQTRAPTAKLPRKISKFEDYVLARA